MLRDLVAGVDHVVIAVKNLTKSAAAWGKLGFTVAPRGIHSAAMGTANHTIMFGPDYLELLGVVKATATNQDTRKLLAKREGIERTAFATGDAAGLARAIRQQGIEPVGPLHFSRPVDTANGKPAEAKFSTCRWPSTTDVCGMTIFACCHHTPKLVWLKELQAHANTARRIKRIKFLSSDPHACAGRLAELTGKTAKRNGDGSSTVASGRNRAELQFFPAQLIKRRHEGIPMPAWPEQAAFGMTIEVDDLAAARKAIGKAGIVKRERIVVPPSNSSGLLLCFEQK